MNRRDLLMKLSLTGLILPNITYAKSNYIQHIQVRKSKRKLDLIKDNTVLKSYSIRLGNSPVGHKFRQGDGKTPEGQYYINMKKNNSSYHLGLKISYPNRKDRIRAQKRGVNPGGSIFIHGQPNGLHNFLEYDWTRGCIALSNPDIEELFSVIPIRCPIVIYP